MMNTSSCRGRLRASVAAAVLLTSLTFGVAGCGSAAAPLPASTTPAAQSASASPPAPSVTTEATEPSEIAPPTPTAGADAKVKAPAVQGPLLPSSEPVSLSIPSIEVTTDITPLGLDANGEMEVPTGEPGAPAGWYKHSPTPGELGPSVILAHVNTTTSDVGIFYRLHELKPGEQFTVTRADGTVATFAVDKSEVFKKATFPTLSVYGNTDRAEIRLITCGGYEPGSGEYTENTVVYGHLLSSHEG